MECRFESFPYNQTTWILSIAQLRTKNPDDSLVFSNQFSKEVNLSSFDFSKVKNLIIGTGVSEVNAYGDHTNYLQNTLNNCQKLFPNLENIYIFYTTIFFDVKRLVSNCNLTTIHIPYFLLRSTLTDLSQFTPWNVGDKKAICLPGDIRNRIHKFQLLYYFDLYDTSGILNYSLMNHHQNNSDYFSDHHLGSVIKSLNRIFDANLDLESFIDLFEKMRRDLPDDVDFIERRKFHGLTMYTQLFPKQWNDSSCNLVLETIFYDMLTYLGHEVPNFTDNGETRFFMSEKMWKPIVSGKPFITFSANDALYDELEKLGFRTFLKYTSHPEKIPLSCNLTYEHNVDFPENYKQHCKICYDRTSSFLNNIEQHKVSIIEDINFNFARWKELSQQTWNDVYQKCPPAMDMTRYEFCEIFNYPVCVSECTKIEQHR